MKKMMNHKVHHEGTMDTKKSIIVPFVLDFVAFVVKN